MQALVLLAAPALLILGRSARPKFDRSARLRSLELGFAPKLSSVKKMTVSEIELLRARIWPAATEHEILERGACSPFSKQFRRFRIFSWISE